MRAISSDSRTSDEDVLRDKIPNSRVLDVTGTSRATIDCRTPLGMIPIRGNPTRYTNEPDHHLSYRHKPDYLAEFSIPFNSRYYLTAVLLHPACLAGRTPPMFVRVNDLTENYA